MPRLDGTGPNGNGSGTGRGLGNCSPNQKNDNQSDNQVISKKPLFGRGLGLGRKNGGGFRNRGR